MLSWPMKNEFEGGWPVSGGSVRLNLTFQEALLEHQKRYPLIKPQDYAKLAYQSAYGPAHFAPDKQQLLWSILKEWEAGDGLPPLPEPIGNGLCRFHLSGGVDLDGAALLAKLICLTAQNHQGSFVYFKEALAALEAMDLPDMAEWLENYRRKGLPPVHHSQVFHQSYRPRYRLLKNEYAGYFPVLHRIQTIAKYGKPAIAAIDGRCGSGKSGLAALISQTFDCNIFHMDDFYLPAAGRKSDWEEVPGGNMDFKRFEREVLKPVKAGESVSYRPYDCRTGEMRDAVETPFKPVTIVEGSYSHHPDIHAMYDFKVFLTCSKTVQASRLKQREGARFSSFEKRWIPMEERYFERFGILEDAALCIDTSFLF